MPGESGAIPQLTSRRLVELERRCPHRREDTIGTVRIGKILDRNAA
jgi:hypothetical protein